PFDSFGFPFQKFTSGGYQNRLPGIQTDSISRPDPTSHRQDSTRILDLEATSSFRDSLSIDQSSAAFHSASG
ncbi:MAG: hypothetical protein KGQ60_15140, partial [Planctomycetes bacterium]|nr:hypothetical protein [Planctomycetota bacterium]